MNSLDLEVANPGLGEHTCGLSCLPASPVLLQTLSGSIWLPSPRGGLPFGCGHLESGKAEAQERNSGFQVFSHFFCGIGGLPCYPCATHLWKSTPNSRASWLAPRAADKRERQRQRQMERETEREQDRILQLAFEVCSLKDSEEV